MIVVDAPSELDMDTGEPVMVTIMLQAADGTGATTDTPTTVTLSSATGTFSSDAEGTMTITEVDDSCQYEYQ